ncbi:MAG: hypothetical protein HRU70_03720 [Phycisphaeraceae bacterium]|nr:MAG: hypothetical protein HRU70_03720 [Phycisphaeraceae bacterium]
MPSKTFRALGLVSVVGLAAGAMLAAAPWPATQPGALDPQITREGEGARRARLNAMELKPFNADHWNLLSEWTNGPALTSATTADKVVMIVTWANWSRNSVRVMERMRGIAERNAGKDLIVVAVHDKDEWADAPKPASPEGAIFLIAKDTKGEFRKAIESDQDPDLYFIDRAGQLRYADVTTEAAEDAVKKLIAESASNAAGIQGRITEDARRAEEEARRTASTRSRVDLSRVPEVPFRPPSEAEYAAAKWPVFPLTQQERDDLRRTGNKPEPRSFVLPDSGFVPGKPNTRGRMVVVYFFHPDMRNSAKYLNDFVRQLNVYQRQNARDMVIVGAVSDIWSIGNQSGEKDAEHAKRVDPEIMTGRLRDYSISKELEHSFVLDLDNNLLKSTLSPNQQSQEILLPHVAVVSTDGTLRWYGNFYEPGCGGAIDRVLAEDPGIRARREAEAAWIRDNPGRR